MVQHFQDGLVKLKDEKGLKSRTEVATFPVDR